MTDYRFSLIVSDGRLTHEQILDVTDKIGTAGCTDASVRGHTEGIELMFERAADSLQDAIASAIVSVERAGFKVFKVEMEREAIQA